MPKLDLAAVEDILSRKKGFISHGRAGSFKTRCGAQPLGRLVLTEKGILHIRVKDRLLLVPAWYCAWIPANTPHEIWSNSKELFVRNVFFQSAMCKNPCFHAFAVFNGTALFREMVRYTEKWNEKKDEDPYEIAFLTVIRQMLPEEMERALAICLRSSDKDGFQKVLEYIHRNFHENISMTELVRITPYSLRTLQRLFEQETGLSFSSYLKMVRMLKAIELLSGMDKRVSEVAWEVGYSSLPTFSNTFFQLTGQRPEEFLKKKG